MKFEVANQVVVVRKVEPKRGKSEDSYVSVRIVLELADVPTSAVAGALCADDAGSVRSAFFKPLSVDADENKAFLNLSTLHLRQAFENVHTVTFKGERPMRCSRVGDIVLEPTRAGKFDGMLVIVVDSPKPGFIEKMSDQLNRMTRITLQQEGELDLKIADPDNPETPGPVTTTVGDEVAKARAKKAAKKRPAKKKAK